MALQIAERYRRWRHSRGFGVHSPLAYSLVCNVIRPLKRGYAYYARPDIVHLLGSGVRIRREKRRALMLHRLAARYSYGSVKVLTTLPPSMTEALKGVSLNGTLNLFVAVSPDSNALDRLHEACGKTDSVIAIFGVSRADIYSLIDAMANGVALHSPDSAIIFTRADVRKTSYSIII